MKALKAVKNAVTVVSTGSPSDGLGPHEGSESSTSVSAFIASQKQTTAEKDGNDWVVDEIVVAGDDSDPRYGQSGHSGSERDTTTRSRHSSSAGGSVRRGTEAHGTESAEEYYQSGYWDWIRLVGWPTVLVFFNPRFEDPEQESDFQKLSWFTTKAWALCVCCLLLFVNACVPDMGFVFQLWLNVYVPVSFRLSCVMFILAQSW